MIKILHCVSIMNRAGQETFLMNVFRRINRNEFTFNFLCTRHAVGDYDEEILALGGKIFYLDAKHKKGKISDFIFQVHALSEWFKTHRQEFDIVHLHTYHNKDVLLHLMAAKKANIKIIIHSHNSSGPHPFLHKFLIPICSCFKHTKLACSKMAAEWLFGRKAVKRGKVTIVNNGIDTEKFAFNESVRQEYRKFLGVENYTVWGHIGRFNYQKNHKFLIQSFNEYKKMNPQSKLVLVGQGELEKDIEEQILELGISDDVLLLGVRDDIDKLLNACDCFVFPSLFEGLGIVVVEAQANGLPVFISNTLPIEVVLNKNVYMFPIDSPKFWSDSILNIKMERCSPKVEQFDISFTVNQLEKLYKNELFNCKN